MRMYQNENESVLCVALKQIMKAHNKGPTPDGLQKQFCFPIPSLICSILHPHHRPCYGIKEYFSCNGNDLPPLAQEL